MPAESRRRRHWSDAEVRACADLSGWRLRRSLGLALLITRPATQGTVRSLSYLDGQSLGAQNPRYRMGRQNFLRLVYISTVKEQYCRQFYETKRKLRYFSNFEVRFAFSIH